MQLTKTDFLQFLHCAKSLWLRKHKPAHYNHGTFSDYLQKIVTEGYEIEAHLQTYFAAQPDKQNYSYQTVFKTTKGLFAKADCTRGNEDGTINIYEVKSSTKVHRSTQKNQIKDAAFQLIAAEGAGFNVKKIFIVHLNGMYVRDGDIDAEQLLTFSDVTAEVKKITLETKNEIDHALRFLKRVAIDESSCSCLGLTEKNHCDTFEYFNPNIPKPSIYNLPRISKKKLSAFVADGRFDLDEIALDEVTEKQAKVLRSAHLKKPSVDHELISNWFRQVEYPVYFLDYETYASAAPLIDGARPHSPIPFQYSLHIKQSATNDGLEHVEFIADEAALPIKLIEHMGKYIGDCGSVVSWHASFENTQNRNMALIYPEKHNFLNGLIKRTLDLEDLFKESYVDIEFLGSTSIKKVLPVLVPDLDYSELKVASGTDAMEAWQRLINLPNGPQRSELRKTMLEYCELDTLAMVRIFEFMEEL